MEKNLQAAVEKINELFGTSISVRFNEEIKEEEAEVEGEPDGTGEAAQPAEETPVEEDETSIDTVEEVKVEETKKESDE